VKNKIYILLLLVAICFPITVNALTGNVTVSCTDTSVSSGENLNCSIVGDGFSEAISSFHGKVVLGDGLTLQSATKDSSWEGLATNGIIDLYTDVNKTGKVNFATFIVKADEVTTRKNVTISIDEIVVSDSNFEESSLNSISIDIEILENDTTNNDDNNNDSSNNNNNDDTTNNNDNNNDSSNNNNNNPSNNDFLENPKTGNFGYIVIFIIMFSSLTVILIYIRKRRDIEWNI